ncbi:protein kinase domain-containing protein [Saccharopolyspora griseoalba]|uniref:non-specific serine/threonine protein kinase n=1 Tax=Saccharopolyspora griseoalba TaxID=1431848 RepID=A0ABW2LEX1_9PSEU
MRDDQLVPSRADVAESGRVIGGRYRLERTIGRGGMGYVWSGSDILLGRQVAVKELRFPPGLPSVEAAEMRERALREARAMATLSHPNTVMLYDVAREADQPFVVMELVAGQSISALLKTHRALNHYQLAVFVDGVAAALQAAHRVGIVHRDVKPGNVLLGPLGQVKLADFGLSRNVAEATMTRSEMLVGTPTYLPPEIARSRTLEASADLWSLGATLYAAAEGRPPYDKSTDPLATISSIVHGPLPRHHQTGPIGEVLGGLLVKNPEQRMPLSEVRNRLRELVLDAGEQPFEALLNPSTATTERMSVPKPPSAQAIPRQHDRRAAPPPPPGRARRAAPAPRRPAPAQPKRAAPLQDTPSRAIPSRLPVRTPVALAVAGVVLVVGAATIGFLAGREGPGTASVSNERSLTFGEAYRKLQVEQGTTVGRRVSKSAEDGVRYLGSLAAGDVLRLDGVAFGPVPATEVVARLRTTGDATGAHLDIRLDRPDGELVGRIDVASAGGGTGWRNAAVRLGRGVTGTHTVHLVVGAANGQDDLVQLDWIRFHR